MDEGQQQDRHKVFAVSGGDPTQFWAQGRMKGFEDIDQGGDPGREIRDHRGERPQHPMSPARPMTPTVVPTANPSVQFIENVDIGAEHADRAIKSWARGQGVHGRLELIKGQSKAIERGNPGRRIRSALAGSGGVRRAACASSSKNGVILPNTQTLKAVLKPGGRGGAQGARSHHELAREARNLESATIERNRWEAGLVLA